MPTPDSSSIVLAVALRTPIGRFGGGLAGIPAPELAATVVRRLLDTSGVERSAISTVILGNARGAGVGPNPARQVVRLSDLPDAIPAWTLNQACGSGLRGVISGMQSVQLGESRIVLAGGAESMSRVPFMVPEARFGHRLGHTRFVDGMYRDGFLCPLCGLLMGETAENLAASYGISRAEQDAYALESQQRAATARREGRFDAELVPVQRPDGSFVSADEHPRDGVTLDGLARLPPVFRENGSVHAGNASGITDGAAMLLVMTEETAMQTGVEPMARVIAYATAGVDPRRMGIGPVPAVKQVLTRTGLQMGDIDLIELNEAFAVQVLACQRDLDLDLDRVNVNGGAIALGHPIGATGARIVVTLLHEMRRQSARRGLATLCVSGGMGLALLVETI
ncbi:MAG: thiolase family protein [Acidobacteriota bacterium]